jgi:hypothetical protein
MILLEMVFKKIANQIETVNFKEFDSPPDKFGLRGYGNRVIFTYNSHKRGWLDTNPMLGRKLLKIFKFSPSNKPSTGLYKYQMQKPQLNSKITLSLSLNL